MCVCKDGDKQTGSCQNNHKHLIFAHWTSSTERAALWAEEWETDEIQKELIMRKYGAYKQ